MPSHGNDEDLWPWSDSENGDVGKRTSLSIEKNNDKTASEADSTDMSKAANSESEGEVRNDGKDDEESSSPKPGIGKKGEKRNTKVTFDEDLSEVQESNKKNESKRRGWHIFEKKSMKKISQNEKISPNEKISKNKKEKSGPDMKNNHDNSPASTQALDDVVAGTSKMSPSETDSVSQESVENSAKDELSIKKEKSEQLKSEKNKKSMENYWTYGAVTGDPEKMLAGLQDFVEAEISKIRQDSEAIRREAEETQVDKAWETSIAKHKKRQKKSFWSGCHKKAHGDRKDKQKEILPSLQEKLADINKRLSDFDEKMRKEMVEKTLALQQSEKERLSLSDENEKLKVELKQKEHEIHLCSSARDILHITAMDTSRELEDAEVHLCRLKKSNEDLQFDATEDRYLIQQLKEELAAKETEAEQYKKMLVDNQKRVSRTIAAYLRQSNECLKSQSSNHKRYSKSESVLKDLKQERNRFAEQVELLSSHNISLEMHIENIEKQLDNVIKLLHLYETLGIQLELQDIRYRDLNRDAQQYLAFYRAHGGSKNLLNRTKRSEDHYSRWDESLERLQAAAIETVNLNTESSVHDAPYSDSIDEHAPIDTSTPKKQRSESINNNSYPSENGKRQRPLVRRRSHHDCDQLASKDDLNITGNNAANDNPSESSLPLHRTTASKDIRVEDKAPVSQSQSSKTASSCPSSTLQRSILKRTTKK